MCTLSVIPRPGGYLAAMNRDEHRSRPRGGPLVAGPGDPPHWAHPTDPLAGGTWLALSSSGLLLALLNHYPPGVEHSPEAPSRGRIIPSLLGARSAREALAALPPLARHSNPFQLVAVDPDGRSFAVRWDRSRLDHDPGSTGPRIFSSSGWESTVVHAHRERLFQALLRRGTPDRAALRAFHFRGDPARPAFGVSMSRPEACSVAFSEVEVGPGRVLRHLEAPPLEEHLGELVTVALAS